MYRNMCAKKTDPYKKQIKTVKYITLYIGTGNIDLLQHLTKQSSLRTVYLKSYISIGEIHVNKIINFVIGKKKPMTLSLDRPKYKQ